MLSQTLLCISLLPTTLLDIADGVLANDGEKAVINNEKTGVLTNINGANKAVNNINGAKINAAAGSETIVSSNEGSTITYQKGANVSVTDPDNKGNIAYVITADYMIPTEKVEYNTIVVEGLDLVLKTKADQTDADVELSKAEITNIILKDGATVDFKWLKTSESIHLIEIQGKNNKIITDATNGIKAETLKVAKDGYVLIPIYSKVALSGAEAGKGLQNGGSINVGGTLEYKKTGAEPGKLLGTGTITEQDS